MQRAWKLKLSMKEKLSIPVKIDAVDVREFANENKLSIETAARNLRLSSLMDIATSMGCDAIATGHHKNDNAETMIHRMLRGTGFRGLCGIGPEREFSANGCKVFHRDDIDFVSHVMEQ